MGKESDPDQNSTDDEKGSGFTSNERKTEGPSDFVWSFRGYQLKSSEFTTAMVHFFRAEVQRANVWRQRLDTTTNWAVITTGAALSIAFSQSGNHVVIFLNILLVTIFLLIEGRRYRYYELWSYRVRLMETDFFAPMLVPPFHPSPDWAEALSESLLHPTYPISTLEAIGRRLRRNYLYIYTIVGSAWLAKLSLLPHPVSTWGELSERAAIGPVSGMVVFSIAFIFCLIVAIFSIITIRLQGSPGEVLPRFGPEVDGKLMGEKTGQPSKKCMVSPHPSTSAAFNPDHHRPAGISSWKNYEGYGARDYILEWERYVHR